LGLCLLAPLTVPIGNALESNLYDAPIISRTQSEYQRIVLTRQQHDVRLFLDSDLQLSTTDEHRYHEAFVHPALRAVPSPERVLILGGGDGMALREVLKWEAVEEAVVLELDPAVVALASQHPLLAHANGHAFDDPRVRVRYGDAFKRAPELPQRFDAILADFPDPDRKATAKLYSAGFYRRLLGRLAPEGAFVTQASSPFFTPQTLACIRATLEAVADGAVYPYRVNVPSLGPWGFVMTARNAAFSPGEPAPLPVATEFLTPKLAASLFHMPGDLPLATENVRVNRLAHPRLVQYYNNPRWGLY